MFITATSKKAESSLGWWNFQDVRIKKNVLQLCPIWGILKCILAKFHLKIA